MVGYCASFLHRMTVALLMSVPFTTGCCSSGPTEEIHTRYAITVWFFDKEERERAKVECSVQDVSAIKNELMFLELEKMENEKSQLEQKIEQEARKAIKSLTREELQALADLVRDHEDPRGVLSQMGIAASIQNHLLEELRKYLT